MGINSFSQIIELPLAEPRHMAFRDELRLVHAEHACRYYLSILTKRDYYGQHQAAFRVDLLSYLAEKASPLTRCWAASSYICDVALPFMREQFHSTTGLAASRTTTKAERALILLANHPAWNDETIIAKLDTKAKQLARWPTFQLARREQDMSVVGQPDE